MPKIVTPLTASKIQSAKPRDKLYKLSDGGGLALWVFPTGIKSWKLAYRANGKPNTVTLGSFPQFGLQEAREWREETGDSRFSLREGENSEFARAVDKVVKGAVPAGHIDMGTTPDVLGLLGAPDGKVRISGGVIEKVMAEYLNRQNHYDKNRHAVAPEDMKRLPEHLNNPIAVFESATRADAFVVLTELIEQKDGKDKPVIAALHLDKSKHGLDLIDVKSVYGRNDSQLVSAFDTDLKYLHKEKGRQFLKTHPLQLHWDITSDANLSERNIKTNEDLAQYVRDKNRFSRAEKASDTEKSFAETAQQYGGEEAFNRVKADGKTELNYRQWVQVRTPEFKQWFGDWEHDAKNASKVVNGKTGEPLVLYHGSPKAGFAAFDTYGKKGSGAFFTDTPEGAASYSGSLNNAVIWDEQNPEWFDAGNYAVFLNIRNPQTTDFGSKSWRNHGGAKQWVVKNAEGKTLRSFDNEVAAEAFKHENNTVAQRLRVEGTVNARAGMSTDELAVQARALGFDGAIFENVRDDGTKAKKAGVVLKAWVAFNPNQVKSATGNTGAFSREDEDIRYSRSSNTKEKYEQRIDELFDGGKAKLNGVTVLDRSDMLDMLGYGDMPVSLAEGKVVAGRDNHPLMSREVWKKIPEWIDNPALVFDSDTEKGRLVFIAPEKINGRDVRIIITPNAKSLDVHLLLNAYDNTHAPYMRWVEDRLLRYADTKKAQGVDERFGRRLPDILKNPAFMPYAQIHGMGRGQTKASELTKILTEKNLQGYRKRNPFEEDGVKFSRAEGGRDVVHDAASEKRSLVFPKAWTNERGELLLGVKAFEKTGALLKPVLAKLKLANTHPEVFTQYMRDFRAQKNVAALTAKNISDKLIKISPAERELLSDILEKELPPGAVVSPELQELAGAMRELFSHQTDQLVELGMLNPETAERHRDTYLPRLYKKHMKLFDDTDLGKANREFRKAYKKGLGQAISGSHLKGRGIFKEVKKSEVPEYEAKGFQLRHDFGGKGERAGKVLMWKDYTRDEREQMGEVRDAGLRLTTGYVATQADIAKGVLFKRIADDASLSSAEEVEGWTRVPDTGIAATGGVKRYGALAGMYVHPEVAYHLQQQFYIDRVIQKNWRKTLGWWKVSKTALNPVAHGNNFISNISMLFVAGGSPADLPKAAVELKNKGDYFREAVENALIGEAVDVAGLQEMFVGLNNAKNDGGLLDGLMTRFAKYTDKVMLNAPSRIGGKMMKVYQWEDEVFKMALYIRGRERGLSATEAADWARTFIFDYSEVPQGIKWVRDTGLLPFVSYNYKAIPAVYRAALTRPHRFLAVTAFLHGINALSYALLGSAANEDDEREYMPDYQKGYTVFGTPKLIRLPFNDAKGKPVFVDVYRWLPLGDFADTQNQMGGLPIPQFLMPNGPVVNHFSALAMNTDTFTGNKLTKDYMSGGEKTAIYGKWLAQQWLPSSVGVPFSYHTNSVLDGVKNQFEGTKFADALEWMGYTGTNYRGEDKQLYRAGFGAFGLKLRGENPQDLKAARERRTAFEAREIKMDMGRIKRDKTLSDSARSAKLATRREALSRLYGEDE